MQRSLVVGSGSIAKRHMGNLRHLYPDMEVVCVSSSGRHLDASEVGASLVMKSIDQVLETPLDFAIVASPAPFHLANAHKLSTANIPVLVEKPISHDLKELAKYDFSNCASKLGVAYNLRYMPAARKVKEIITSTQLGRIYSAYSQCGQYLPDWRPGTDYRKGVSAQQKLGGGALLELSHELDYLLWFFGPAQKVVANIQRSGALDIDVEDNVSGLLLTESNITLQIHLDFLQRHPKRSLSVVAEKGTLVWDLIKNKVVIIGTEGNAEEIYSDELYDRNEMYIDQLREFSAFARGEGDFSSSFDSASSVLKVVEAMRLSVETNKWEEVIQ